MSADVASRNLAVIRWMYVKARIFVEFVPWVKKKNIGEKRSCNKSAVVEIRFEGKCVL